MYQDTRIAVYKQHKTPKYHIRIVAGKINYILLKRLLQKKIPSVQYL